MLPKNTPKIQIPYPKSFNCFAEIRCYPVKYMQFFSSFYSEHASEQLIAEARKLRHKYICEITFFETGAILQFTCNDARRPAHYIKLSDGQFADVACVIFKVED